MLKPLTAFLNRLRRLFSVNIEIGTSLASARENAIIFLPHRPNTLFCGISALVAFKGAPDLSPSYLDTLTEKAFFLGGKTLSDPAQTFPEDFLGGNDFLNVFFKDCQALKQEKYFSDIFFNPNKQDLLVSLKDNLEKIATDQNARFKYKLSTFSPAEAEIISQRLERLWDITWCIKKEILENIAAIENLAPGLENSDNIRGLTVFKRINAVLNSMDRLEVRGRDSAGISALFTFTKEEFEHFRDGLIKAGHSERLKQRTNHIILSNNSLTIHDTFPENGQHFVSISFSYKFAAEIGALGDNIAFLRSQIKNDHLDRKSVV